MNLVISFPQKEHWCFSSLPLFFLFFSFFFQCGAGRLWGKEDSSSSSFFLLLFFFFFFFFCPPPPSLSLSLSAQFSLFCIPYLWSGFGLQRKRKPEQFLLGFCTTSTPTGPCLWAWFLSLLCRNTRSRFSSTAATIFAIAAGSVCRGRRFRCLWEYRRLAVCSVPVVRTFMLSKSGWVGKRPLTDPALVTLVAVRIDNHLVFVRWTGWAFLCRGRGGMRFGSSGTNTLRRRRDNDWRR